jgi:methionine-rich copper-binding protein CopC
MRRFLIAIATAGLFAVLFAPAAAAAPAVVDSDPADGAEEHQAPDAVTITFDMPLDPETSLIKVVDECGRRIDAENTSVQLNEMTVDIAEKPAGLYKAFYYANPPAGATGSSTGYIDFTVHAGPSCGPEGKSHHGHGGGGNDGGHEGHGGSGHEGGNHGSSHEAHTGNTDHTTHSGSSSDHSTHTSAATHTDHASGNGNSAHGGSGRHTDHHKNGGGKVRAAGGDRPPPTAAPGDALDVSDGQAILISLAACLVLGVAGGWMIRTTQAPRKPA